MKLKDAYALKKKAMTNLESLLKSRGIILPTKIRLVKPIVFPVVVYGCESWTVKKAEHQRIDGFELWWWRPLNCKEIKPVSPKGNRSYYSLEELMLKLKLQYFGHMIQRTDSMKKTLMLGKKKNKNGRQKKKGMTEDEIVGWHHRFNGHEFEQALVLGDGQGSLACCSPWGHRVRRN